MKTLDEMTSEDIDALTDEEFDALYEKRNIKYINIKVKIDVEDVSALSATLPNTLTKNGKLETADMLNDIIAILNIEREKYFSEYYNDLQRYHNQC